MALKCPAERYEEAVFAHCLYRHARLLVPLIRLLRPAFFVADVALVKDVREVRSWGELSNVLADWSRTNRNDLRRFRRFFRLRVSGRRLQRLAGRALMR